MSDKNSDSTVPFESKRVPFERTIILKFEQFSGFIKEYSANISMGGMFVRTTQLREPGSVFEFAFKLSDDYNLIQGVGEVVWVREEPEPGMGIRFLELDWESRKLIFRLVDQYIQDGGVPFDVEKGPQGQGEESDEARELLEALDLEPEEAVEVPAEAEVEAEEIEAESEVAEEGREEEAGGYFVEDGPSEDGESTAEEVLLSDLVTGDVEMPEPATESPYGMAGVPSSVALSSRDNRGRRGLLIGLPVLIALLWGGWWFLESGRARPVEQTADVGATGSAAADRGAVDDSVTGGAGEEASAAETGTATGSGDEGSVRGAGGAAGSTAAGSAAGGSSRRGGPDAGSAPPNPDLEAARRQAEGTVQAWAATWANQDVDVYLNFYSSRFSPPAGLSRAAWEAQRHERLTTPRSIQVEVSSLSVEATTLERATARFTQSYSSDRYQDVVTKVLTLVWEEGQWRILREEVAES